MMNALPEIKAQNVPPHSENLEKTKRPQIVDGDPVAIAAAIATGFTEEKILIERKLEELYVRGK